MSDERETLHREFPVDFASVGDGRTIEARIVPYNTPTVVADAGGPPYTETWLPGVFEKQTRAADKVKVWLNFEHEGGLRGLIGHGAALDDRADALYGTFRVHENADGDKALQLVRDGLLTGISLEAVAMRSTRRNGIVERERAHLDKVALCRSPAFEEAQVLAVREAPEEEPEEEPAEPESEPVDEDAVVEALARVGWTPLPTLRRAIVDRPWSGSPARFSDEQYARSCLVDRGGEAPPKERCSLPVLEPNGDLNVNALGAAASALAGGRTPMSGVSATMKAAAARKLIRYYNQAQRPVPDSLRALASR